MRCWKCETDNPEGNRFWGHRRGAREKGFPECGTDEPVGERLCPDCDAAPAVSGAASWQSSSRKPFGSGSTLQARARAAVTTPQGEQGHFLPFNSPIRSARSLLAWMRETAARAPRYDEPRREVMRVGGQVGRSTATKGIMCGFVNRSSY